jgi:hypothetical protein
VGDLAAAIKAGRVGIVDTSRFRKFHTIYTGEVRFRPSLTLSVLGSVYLFALAGEERAQLHAAAQAIDRACADQVQPTC